MSNKMKIRLVAKGASKSCPYPVATKIFEKITEIEVKNDTEMKAIENQMDNDVNNFNEVIEVSFKNGTNAVIRLEDGEDRENSVIINVQAYQILYVFWEWVSE